MKKKKPDIPVKEFLNGFPVKIRKLAENARTVIRKTIPAYIEAVYPGWKLIGYRVVNGKKSHYFAFIYPTEDKVVLGFEYGFLMSDPERILTGNTKQVKWIDITCNEDINEEIFMQYISEAALFALSKNDIIKKK